MPGPEITVEKRRVPSPLPRVRSEKALKNAAGEEIGTDVLSNIEWVQDLYGSTGGSTGQMQILATCGAMSGPGKDTGIDPDHLFLSMLRQKLISDICFMWNPTSQTFYTLLALGSDIAGHPRVTHGGFTSAVIDETTGGLVFELKKAGLLGTGPAYTAHLEIDFRVPLPVNIVVCCQAKVISIEGRKIWVSAEMLDKPGGIVFASGKALYVTPRQEVLEGPPAAS